MRSTLLFSLALLAPLPALAGEITTNSRLLSINLYVKSEALMTREVVVDLPAGESTLVINDMPSLPDISPPHKPPARPYSQILVDDIAPNSLSITSIWTSDSQAAADMEKSYMQEMKKFDENHRLYTEEFLGLQSRRFYARNALSLRPDEKVEPNELKERNELEIKAHCDSDEAVKDLLKVEKRIIWLENEIKSNLDKMSERQREYNRTLTLPISSKTVRLTASTSTAGRYRFLVRYEIANTHWEPFYEYRLNQDEKKLHIIRRVKIKQDTGEDWKHIAVSLFPDTASLPLPFDSNFGREVAHQNGPLPRPSAQHKGECYPEFGCSSYIGEATLESYITGMGLPPLPDDSKSWYRLTDATIKPVSNLDDFNLETGKAAEDISLEEYVIDAHPIVRVGGDYMGPAARLIVKAIVPGKAVFPEGTSLLYINSNFIGNDRLPTLEPGQEFELDFGENVLVRTRYGTPDEKPTKLEIKDNQAHFKRTEGIDIANLSEAPVVIEALLFRPVPDSPNTEIKILESETTRNFKALPAPNEGYYKWSFTLSPKEQSRVTLAWAATFPEDVQAAAPVP